VKEKRGCDCLGTDWNFLMETRKVHSSETLTGHERVDC
jgi:hypothetical protein